jgi:hypothetical protein
MARRRRHNRYRRRWVIAYWAAAALNLLFVLLALTGEDVSTSAYFAVLTGAVTSTAGASMATHLDRVGIGDVEFDDVTATMRVIVVGWLMLCLTLVVTVMVATDFGARSTVGPETTDAVVAFADGIAAQLFGVAALFVIMGDGYTKYRRALAQRDG